MKPVSSRRQLLKASTLGIVTGSAAHAGAATPASLLDPYYREIAPAIDLPRAPEGPSLAEDTLITRLTVGSCNNQEGDQAFWQGIRSRDPQLFLYIGDCVYGDPGWDGGADLGSLRRAYERLNGHAQFRAFRQAVPMLTVWDDHDFGFNDGGAVFPFKRWSEHIYETFWNSPEDVRGREGVYQARTYGPPGRRLQIILLDTRFQRSSLVPPPEGTTLPVNGRYVPDTSEAAQMLGETQWRWLAAQLARPADVRIVVSSIQVLSDAHLWEGWELMPHQRERLYSVLAERAGGGLVLLSGDRHVGGIYRKNVAGFAQGLFEMTASSLNRSNASNAQASEREPDADRLGMCVGDDNFGEVQIDWATRELALTLCRSDGVPLVSHTLDWSA